MAITIEIIIKGVAICYEKGIDWHVLFPVDNKRCHKINFSYRKKDDFSVSAPVSLVTTANEPIVITATDVLSETSQTTNFRARVLDLTSLATHPKIRKKRTAPGKAILLTIPSAEFSVYKFLEEYGAIPPLKEVGAPGNGISLTSLAHTVQATIILKNTGILTVKNSKLPQGRFDTQTNTSYVMTFDNDCEMERPGINDMDMFYDIIEEDSHTPNRKFRIGGVGSPRKSTFIDPPDYAKGKPCLVVKASDPGDLP